MPPILCFGGLRVVIYTNDRCPPHVHVIARGAAARIALGGGGERPWLITNEGLSRRELGKALVEIDRNRTLLMRRWREIHGDP